MTALPDEASAVLDLWFGPLDRDGLADSEHTARWFEKNPDFDARLKQRFGALHATLSSGLPDEWQTPRAKLAAVIVLDQFSRNIFRGQAAMFASDPHARRLSRALCDSGEDRGLATHERLFLYMPFMHSESLDDQRLCLELLEGMRQNASERAADAIAQNVRFAHMHLEIIERFGRFPHRNEILGRDSSEAERAFLEQPGSSF